VRSCAPAGNRKEASKLLETIRVLVLGDIVGQPGVRAVFLSLQALMKAARADLVVANAENAADGLGLTPDIAAGLFNAGIHVITSGNHIWQRGEILPLLESEQHLLRPENYPVGVPGRGHCLLDAREVPVAVVNLQGRRDMYDIRCPFTVGKPLVRRLRQNARVIVVDFHAEATDEKEALAFSLDGEVSAVVGTHTHVQSADERILPGGTAYITDIGMTGPREGVIGMKREVSIRRSLTQIPIKMEVDGSPPVIMGVLLSIGTADGRATAIERFVHEPPALSAD
jgi:metallophosphoesterase (TIGR00282 family)